MTCGLTRRTAFQFGIAASLASARSWAQERGRIYHLGSLFSAPRDAPHQIVLLEGLRRSGFMEGQNLSVDWRGYVYDCDFNQMLDLPLSRAGRERVHSVAPKSMMACV